MNILPMKINLEPAKRSVKVITRKYPDNQRKFLGSCLSELVDSGFIESSAQSSWQAAPHLVPTELPAKFRAKISLRPVNAASIKEQWSMPNIDAEISEFKGTKHLALLESSASYWKCPLHPSSYDACGIMTPH